MIRKIWSPLPGIYYYYINCDLHTHLSGGVLLSASVFVAALYYFVPVDRY